MCEFVNTCESKKQKNKDFFFFFYKSLFFFMEFKEAVTGWIEQSLTLSYPGGAGLRLNLAIQQLSTASMSL